MRELPNQERKEVPHLAESYSTFITALLTVLLCTIFIYQARLLKGYYNLIAGRI